MRTRGVKTAAVIPTKAGRNNYEPEPMLYCIKTSGDEVFHTEALRAMNEWEHLVATNVNVELWQGRTARELKRVR